MRLALLLLLAACGAAHAADDVISPDQPDFTDSPDVVAAGRFQIETGGAWQRTKANGLTTRLRSTPTLLRYGLGHDLELRLDTEGWLRQSNPSARGRGDIALGTKWQMQEGDEGKPGMGWLLEVQTPTGSGPFKGRGLRPMLAFLAEWDLPAGYSLGTMAGLLTDRNDADQRYTAGVLSASLGIPLGEKLRSFAEVAGQQLASSRNGGKVVTASTGLAWLVNNDVQLSTAVFRGLNRSTPDWEWTVGLSLRF